MGNARHPISDTLFFTLGTLQNIKTGVLALWYTKIMSTLENSEGPRIRKAFYREIPSSEATFDRQMILKR